MEYTSLGHYIQETNKEYVKTEHNDETYDTLEVIAEVIDPTNQAKSKPKLENMAMVEEMKNIKKLKKMTKQGKNPQQPI